MIDLKQLESDGIVVLPGFVGGETLTRMQRAFNLRLSRLRWNDFDGYEKTERFRHMVQDVLMLEQGFVDTALHPAVKEALRSYIGDGYELVEAKGWKSLPTRKVFHGWHGDAWFDKSAVSGIPRELKLGLYLTDVKTGYFRYMKGSHRTHVPRGWRTEEVEKFPADRMAEVAGSAGTAFLFDTSGVHGQSWPILEPRHAVFYNYHDPSVPLQPEDIDYYRYHPLALNAAFLGNLTAEDRRILGFGNKSNYVEGFERKQRHGMFQAAHSRAFDFEVVAEELRQRVGAKLQRMLK